MTFTLHRSQSSGSSPRRGSLKTAHGAIETPFFMPIATKGAVKTLSSADMAGVGAGILLSNTYHLYMRPGLEIMQKAGGLHRFMNWSGPILTDSGGYQVFSLSKMRTLSEQGVEFQSPWDGSKHMLTPEKSIAIQQTLGSDIVMAFDECPPYPCEKKYAHEAVERTTRWAQRSKEQFQHKTADQPNRGQLLFGIVQGSVYADLRAQSARELQAIGFDGYAIGGLAVGEPTESMYETLASTLEELPADKPRYLMGVGKPENIVQAVRLGVDMFDCVIPSRNARHGLAYVWREKNAASDSAAAPKSAPLSGAAFYETVHITNEKNKTAFTVLDSACGCLACGGGYTRAYLHHLFRVGEALGQRLLTAHNIKFYLDLMTRLKGA